MSFRISALRLHLGRVPSERERGRVSRIRDSHRKRYGEQHLGKYLPRMPLWGISVCGLERLHFLFFSLKSPHHQGHRRGLRLGHHHTDWLLKLKNGLPRLEPEVVIRRVSRS